MENTYKIEGMSCGHCVMAVEKELSNAHINSYKVEIGMVTLDIKKNNTSKEDVIKAIEKAGYRVINNK